jgi:type I restriction enzyme, S subunit
MSLPRYGDYRKTGVAWLADIPSHWQIYQARRLFEQRRDPSLPGDEQLSATQKYGVIPQRLFMEQEDQKVVLALGGLDNFKRVQPDDFVISLRSFQGGIERSRYSGCVSPAYTVLRPQSGLVPGYWEHLLKSSMYIAALQTTTDGIRDGKSISYGQFGALPVPLPSRREQTAIVAFLDHETAKIDALIAEQEKLIALLAEKRQATVSRAVTRGLNLDAPMKYSGVSFIGEVPAHWGVAALKRHWSVTDCKHITAEFVDEGYPLASIREVQSRYVSLDAAKRTTQLYYEQLIEGGRKPLPGDLILSRNATVGEVAQVTDKHPLFAMGQDVCLLRKLSHKSSTDFMQSVISSEVVVEQLKNIMVGSTFKRVNVEEIRALQVPIPPPIEQVQIAAFIAGENQRLDSLEKEAVRAIDLLKERRTALIAAAVTGQIDVRGLATL